MIQDYVQYNPSKIIFGKGAENNVAEEIKSHGGTRVLIHFDAGDFITPLIKKIHTQLEEAGLTVFELGGVVPNPKVSLMKEGCKLVRENDVDFILAVGGGSTMDSSKYIACGAYYEGDIWDHPKYQPITTKIVKHGVIVTMPGTGSEVSTAAVWRDDTTEPERKTCVFANEMRFDFVLINPELTYTLPPFQTAAGCFDIISHSMEDYFCAPEDAEFYLSAYEGVINDVMKNVKIALKDPTNYVARANICRCSYIPLEDIIISGSKHGYCVHNLEKPMTATYHKTHGQMLAILFPAWMKVMYEKNIPLFTRLSVKCFGAKMDYANPVNIIMEGINNLEHFIKDIGLSTRLSEIGIGEENFQDCADYGIAGGTDGYIGMGIKCYKDDILKVYKTAL